MATTMPAQPLSTPRNSLDRVQPRMAKASQTPSIPVQGDQSRLTTVVRDGLLAACGSLKAAALTMGMDQGQLTRELQSGAFKFERLERLSETERGTVIEHLHQAFSPLTDPTTFVLRTLDEIQKGLNAVRAFVMEQRA